jgi:ABC-type ATPase involved in cell division
VLKAIEIQRLRGIRTGKLENLAPLNILVGRSGAGKSTVLDALLIAASGSPGDAIGRVVRRRAELLEGAPWLFERRGRTALIQLTDDTLGERMCRLSWTPEASNDLVKQLPPRQRRRNPVEVSCEIGSKLGHYRARTVISVGNEYRFDRLQAMGAESLDQIAQFQSTSDVRLIEPAAGANHAPLHRPFSEATEQGHIEAILEILGQVLDGAVNLRVLTVADVPTDQPVLHIEFKDHTVPVTAVGGGIYALVRLAIDLAAMPGGIALIEEPEAHEHPAAIHQTARVLLASARRGVQIVVSTHSLDLIDSLLAEATDDDLGRLAITRVALDGGLLRSSHFPGPMAATARRSLDEDLR